jgi:hypothetical protein
MNICTRVPKLEYKLISKKIIQKKIQVHVTLQDKTVVILSSSAHAFEIVIFI